jgi:RNA polymerase sigma factor (sigma-70 family)
VGIFWMATTSKKYDLDLSKMEDEQLIVLAQECGYQPAANEVLRRHHPRLGRLIAYQAKRTTLTPHDVEDAQQNAVFALVEAIAGYDTQEMVKPGGCRFRTYGRLVSMRRFWNFVKQIRRRQERHHTFARVDGLVAVSSPLFVCVMPGPGDLAARQEMRERLSHVLGRIGEKMRALWQALAAGRKLRQIACQQGISYDAVKRQRRRLLVFLSTAVGERAPPAQRRSENRR